MKKQKSDVASRCQTLEQLAELVGRNVRTIQRNRKRHDAPPLTPGNYDVGAWRKYFADRGRDGLPDTEEFRELKNRKLLAECEDREHRIAMLRKQFVRRCAVIERWNFHTQRCTAVLLEMADRFADEIVGCDAIEIRKRAEHFVDHFTHRMRTGT
ncbi:MAG: hypothetical protein ACK49N_03505 [Verrucomicrobiota bacterium]